MRKIFSIAFILLLSVNSLVKAQDDKKFRFGIRVAPTPTWLRSNDTKKYEKNGMRFGFGYGLITEFTLSDVAHLQTGIGGDFWGGGQTYIDSVGYKLDTDQNFVDAEANDWNSNPKYNTYLLKSRKVKTSYVTVPIMLKLMTKEISAFKYFGQFGGNLMFLTKAKANDMVVDYQTSGNPTIEKTDLNIYKETIPFYAGLNVGAGAEYRISGSTSLMLSVNYLRAFTNLYKSKSKYLVSDVDLSTGKTTRAKQGAFADGIQINIGILF